MNKKINGKLAAVLSAFMIFAAITGCGAKEAQVNEPEVNEEVSDSEATNAAENVTENKTDTETVEEKTENEETEGSQAGDPRGIVILYTSDIHCAVDKGFGYAGLEQIRQNLINKGYNVLLVDNGDAIQGEPIGTITKGKAIIDLMNDAGYVLAVPGNHEFDYGIDCFLELTKDADFTYLSCNFNKEGELIFAPYKVLEAEGKKIGFVGVTTPETLRSSTPKYFQNESGEFIYGFMQDAAGEKLYKAVQDAVDSVKAEGAELVVVLGHIGMEAGNAPYTAADIIENTSGIDAFLDGHSHDLDQMEITDKDGNTVLRSACGNRFEGIGWLMIPSDEGGLSTGVYTWENNQSVADVFGIENGMQEAVEKKTSETNDLLKEVVASTSVELTINDPVEVDDNDKPIRKIRSAETNLGDLCADAYRDQTGADIAFVNGGGVRASIGKGDVTLGDIIRVHPFGNMLCMVEVSGQTILDALEWGARKVPDESGSFLQVSGLTYEIDTTVPNSCEEDENGMFIKISGKRRVGNVKVNGEPIDPARKYKVASHNYMLKNNGDGFTMYDGAELLLDETMLDNQALINYIVDTLGGEVGEEYSDPKGSDRIRIIME